MAEFSAQDVLKSRWDPSLRRPAIRLLITIAAGIGAFGVLAGLLLAIIRPGYAGAYVWLLVLVPLATAGAFAAGAGAIRYYLDVGRVLQRFPAFIFWGGIAGLVVFVWIVGLLFRYVSDVVAAQDGAARQMHTYLGGELTIGELQAALSNGGHWSFWAYLFWPLQFGILSDIAGVVAVLGFVSIVAMFVIWWERKVSGRIQSRLGPMRVGGWHGWAQSLADGLKLIQKEDIIMEGADGVLFRLAPYLAFVPALAAFIALPFGTYWIFRNLDVGLIFILAMLGIEVVGVILAGWASNNKWSVYGGMREACLMVSYEIPMGMSLLVPVLTVGTLRLEEIGELQSGGFHTWLAFANPFMFIAAVTYFVASLANCKRAPFDLPEAESELVAGFLTEYSGFRWCLFFFAEYAAMFVVSGLVVILFLGSWYSPLPAHWGAGLLDGGILGRALYGVVFAGPLWFIAKSFALVFVQLWLRWTLPRIRLDQVMYACVQVLLPLTMVVLLGATVWALLVTPDSAVAQVANALLTLVGAVLVIGFIVIMMYGFMNRRRLVGTMAVDALPGA